MPQKSRPAHPAAPTCSLCAAAQRERFALTHLAAETRARDAGIVFLRGGGGCREDRFLSFSASSRKINC